MDWTTIIDFLKHSIYVPWALMGLVSLVFLIGTLMSKFSEGSSIMLAVNVSMVWLPISMLLSLFAEAYWLYLLFWFLSFIAFAVLFIGLTWICGKYGSPYTGDGGMVMILPIYMFIGTFVGSLLLKGVIVFIHWI